MRNIFRNTIAFAVLAGLVYFVANYFGMAQQMVGVKGASTQKAQDVTNALNSDINKQIDSTLKKTGEVKISDLINGLARFQKIPQDINNMKEYIGEQISTFTNQPKKK